MNGARKRLSASAIGPLVDALARVAAAVEPAGVDLNSGVESAPGIKDADPLARAGEILSGWFAARGAQS